MVPGFDAKDDGLGRADDDDSEEEEDDEEEEEDDEEEEEEEEDVPRSFNQTFHKRSPFSNCSL